MKRVSSNPFLLRGSMLAVLALMLIAPAGASAQTIWEGPLITYSQPSTNWAEAANQDRLTDAVWLTRAGTMGLFNAAVEGAYLANSTPGDTEWAYGDLADYATLSYSPWQTWHGQKPLTAIGQPAVLHLISEDIYLSIRFLTWGSSGEGGFSYERSSPTIVPEPSPAIMLLTGVGVFLGARSLRRGPFRNATP